MGIPLHRMRDVRLLWQADAWGTTPLDLDTLESRRAPHGHVIAVRITAENADEGYAWARLHAPHVLKEWCLLCCGYCLGRLKTCTRFSNGTGLGFEFHFLGWHCCVCGFWTFLWALAESGAMTPPRLQIQAGERAALRTDTPHGAECVGLLWRERVRRCARIRRFAVRPRLLMGTLQRTGPEVCPRISRRRGNK